ncbi:HABP4-PAI-RBP1 domain-containing protein [Aphelenchoides besseyi]|nr:HABP4-PAI-RBP1 domain-containing protein [Aphelenchoides besseyi]KAI6194881.1 HABP4-PAI-RBP1 domain-containing protein [Aphelenchoides besseyi]
MTGAESSDTEYGCTTTNKFAFLDDESVDPSELLSRPKAKKVKQPKAVKTAPVAAPAAPVKQDTKENENRGPNRQGGKFRQQRGGDKVANRFNDGEKPRDENRPPRRDGPPRQFVNGNRPRGPRSDNRQFQQNNDAGFNQSAVQEGERQNKPPRTFNRDGPRFQRRDRLSGSEKTGVRSQVKKQGHGTANWGDTEDQLAGETEAVNQTVGDETQPKVDGEATQNGAVDNAANNENVEQAEPKEEEPPKMTLEEWKAQHVAAKVEFKTRQANEGADQKSLQKFVPLKREDENKKAANDEENKKKKALRSNVVNIELSFRGNDRDNRERRGGNQSRGGPQRGGGRFHNQGPKLDMSTDFPALGGR